MATKIPIADPLNIIGQMVIVPSEVNIGRVIGYKGQPDGGYYELWFDNPEQKVMITEGGFSGWSTITRCVTPEFLSDTMGAHIGTLAEMKAIQAKK